jgi:hypothetical protein
MRFPLEEGVVMLAQRVELLLSLDNRNTRDLAPVRLQVHVA